MDRTGPGRLYVGVAAPGRAMKAICLRSYVALLCAAQRQYDHGDPDAADGYMTLAGYFNSLRELGGMRRLVEDDVRLRCAQAEERRPLDTPAPHRFLASRALQKEPVELTSRERTSRIAESKARLLRPHADKEHVDVLLASNMISVGVDIDRLGMMVVAGQPKTTAEYIQASSRVGRQARWPGLVVTCFNVHKPRDRSHYEQFCAYHESFYRYVEVTSLTPFRVALAPYADAAALAVIEALREERPLPRAPLRTAELEQFLAQPDEVAGDLPTATDQFFARRARLEDGLPAGIGALVLAPKLREIRVQVGFTRLEPVTANLQGEYDLEVRAAALSQTQTWLPASEIRGEGILIALDEDAVRAWERRPAVLARGRELEAGYRAWARTVPAAPPFPGVRFYLLHSLAHLLMSAISLECGYSASALRERIYCAAADDPTPMAAILISTGTPGSEGTLGGLVEQGRRLRAHLRRAYDLGVLCSNDPVCGTHSPEDDPGERHLEGSACHGCLFVAECSCERFNRYLDRALVVPTIGQPAEAAFFAVRP